MGLTIVIPLQAQASLRSVFCDEEFTKNTISNEDFMSTSRICKTFGYGLTVGALALAIAAPLAAASNDDRDHKNIVIWFTGAVSFLLGLCVGARRTNLRRSDCIPVAMPCVNPAVVADDTHYNRLEDPTEERPAANTSIAA